MVLARCTRGLIALVKSQTTSRISVSTRPRTGLIPSSRRFIRTSPHAIKRPGEPAHQEIHPNTLEQYKASYRTNYDQHHIWTRPDKYVGQEISLSGFLGERRDQAAALSFSDIRSASHAHIAPLQIISRRTGENEEAHERFKTLKPHSAVSLKGKLVERVAKSKVNVEENVGQAVEDGVNSERQIVSTRGYEIQLKEIELLAALPSDIIISEDSEFEAQQRHLQLRFDKGLLKRLKFRQALIGRIRALMHGALEVETPILFKSTPEGAREFVVPSRKRGYAYALPQSPQQYKQILMASGIGEYYQFARCFRDEDGRADRQPEFTQFDMEMPFADGEAVMRKIEQILEGVYAGRLPGLAPSDRSSWKLPRMAYQEAMDRHGVDKPDLRIKSLIHRVEHFLPSNLIGMMTSINAPIVEAVKFSISDDPTTTRNFVRHLMDQPEAEPFENNPDGPPGVFIYDPTKPLSGLQAFGFEGVTQLEEYFDKTASSFQEGDLLILQARPNLPHSGGSTTLGRFRTLVQKTAISKDLISADPSHNYLWITDFPMFTLSATTAADGPGQGGSAGFDATHHPFTAPKTPADVDLLFTDPLSAVADHYDLVLNGTELGGGSRRVHNVHIQQYIMSSVLKMSPQSMREFEHLFEALRAGCPPHAGIALGLDRWVALLMGRESVRDVIAFPKSARGEDLTVGSPGWVSDEKLAEYYLKIQSFPREKMDFLEGEGKNR